VLGIDHPLAVAALTLAGDNSGGGHNRILAWLLALASALLRAGLLGKPAFRPLVPLPPCEIC
jgi:hypothetical protein